jgi:ABC-type glycerol-3-phosphate transport system permease component
MRLGGRRGRGILFKIIAYLLLVTGALVVTLPFFWMISTSLKKPGTEFAIPIQWLPHPVRWYNYREAWSMLPFNRWVLNSLEITALCTIGHLVSTSIVAYGFARIDFPGRDKLFIVVLSTMMLPWPSVVAPLFLYYQAIGWLDTYLPLVVPAYFASNAFYVFVLRQFFLTLPRDLEDAARVDGCSTFGVLWHVGLPHIRPALGIVAVFSFMAHWNDFLGPLIFLASQDRFTAALGLRFFQGLYVIQWPLLMAVSLVIVSPCILVFFIAQKYYIQGIVITGVKG